ncbi:hypothetical protein [Streptomyces sp. NBC_00847]|uniref:hypothetical protein n=1 Tax=unclassified Streptomyces TaxID=2593676 RepID=UPI00224F0029|nr:hypothetical protein [Streptomyces sp. NBC_00847]MCX4882268.1 hypothetical protein [Streptomyces sp. NBC_00847]
MFELAMNVTHRPLFIENHGIYRDEHLHSIGILKIGHTIETYGAAVFYANKVQDYGL